MEVRTGFLVSVTPHLGVYMEPVWVCSMSLVPCVEADTEGVRVTSKHNLRPARDDRLHHRVVRRHGRSALGLEAVHAGRGALRGLQRGGRAKLVH